MKEYELSVLIHPDLEMNLDPALDKIKKLIEGNNGKVIKQENDGKKRLAYPVKGQEFAVYYFYNISLPPEAPAKISSTLNITDEIIRHLLVRADERKEKLAKAKETKAKQETNDEKGE